MVGSERLDLLVMWTTSPCARAVGDGGSAAAVPSTLHTPRAEKAEARDGERRQVVERDRQPLHPAGAQLLPLVHGSQPGADRERERKSGSERRAAQEHR